MRPSRIGRSRARHRSGSCAWKRQSSGRRVTSVKPRNCFARCKPSQSRVPGSVTLLTRLASLGFWVGWRAGGIARASTSSPPDCGATRAYAKQRYMAALIADERLHPAVSGRLVPGGKFQLRLAGEPAGGSITGAVGLDDRTASAFAGQRYGRAEAALPAYRLRANCGGPFATFGSNSRCAAMARASPLPQRSRIPAQISALPSTGDSAIFLSYTRRALSRCSRSVPSCLSVPRNFARPNS
jgi:hypothetical protein